jgi:hypothetical protein
VSVRAVAKKHGISFRTAYRIRTRNLEESPPELPSPPEPSPPPSRKELLTEEIQQQADHQVLNWIEQCEPAIAEGVAFLRRSIKSLRPEKLADARFVSQSIVETLSTVASTWRRLEIQLSESNAKAPPRATDITVSNLSDTELREATRGLGASPSTPPPGEPN